MLENSMCSCFNGQDEVEVDCFGYQAVSPDEYELLRKHFTDVTRRLETCLAAPKRCN